MKLRTLTTVTVALLAAVAFEMAIAFELFQPPRRWFAPADEPRVVMVDTNGLADISDGDGGVNAAIGASNAWNSPTGATPLNLINAQSDPNARAAITLGDGISHMIFTDPFRVCERTCLAATFIGYYDTNQTATCDGFDVVKIDDSDIVFNADPGFGPFRIGWTSEGEDTNGAGCSNEIYVESVASHEVGHLIGLDHEEVEVALMNPSADYCDNKPILTDDVEGRDQLYDCSFSTGGGGSFCGDGTCDTGSGEDANNCAADCTDCGDTVVSGDEDCDPPLTTTSCSALGFNDDVNDATCTDNCSWDTSTCNDCTASENKCDDGIDNDCDGYTDTDDDDCSGAPKGASCNVDDDCLSRKCKGPSGRKTCK